jgi:hypothetical protein
LPGADRGGASTVSARVGFGLRSRVFELFLRRVLIGLRRALGCRAKVAPDPYFVGSILLAFVITLRESSGLCADQKRKGDAK